MDKYIFLGLLALSLGVAGAQSSEFYDYGTENCTDHDSDMRDYCEAYCDYYTGEYCQVLEAKQEFDTPRGTIDLCRCRCGVGQEEVTYTDIQCGEDLQRKWSASGEETGGSDGGSSCCLPASILLSVMSLAVLRH